MEEHRGFRKTQVGVITFLAAEFALADRYVPLFKSEIEQCINAGELRIVLDLKKVSYIDSAGLEALIEVDDRIRKKGGILKMANPNPAFKDILVATRLAGRFETFSDTELAGRSLI